MLISICCHCSVISCIQLSVTPWTAACQGPLSSTVSGSVLKFISIESVVPPNHLILCRPLLLLPSIFPSIRGFSNESVFQMRWPKNWSFSLTISPFNEDSGLISFRMDWLDLLAVQGTLKSLLYITALFIIARTWKQPRCPSADEWIRKLGYIYTMEYYSAI